MAHNPSSNDDVAVDTAVPTRPGGRWRNTWALFWRGIIAIGIVSLAWSLALWVLLPQTALVIKMRPTLIFMVTAITIAFAAFVSRVGLFGALFGKRARLARAQWRRFSWFTVALCLFLAVINCGVAWYFSEERWVFYKLNVQGLLLWGLLVVGAVLAAAPEKRTKPNE